MEFIGNNGGLLWEVECLSDVLETPGSPLRLDQQVGWKARFNHAIVGLFL